ncbi:MAG TPA: hypothetical protein H9693_01805 [Firmicutes bacterium]|nr:hypothetical protein [Bacillota bacterium]
MIAANRIRGKWLLWIVIAVDVLCIAMAIAVWIAMGDAVDDVIIPLGIFTVLTAVQTTMCLLSKNPGIFTFAILLVLSIVKGLVTFSTEILGDMNSIYFGESTMIRSVFIVLFLASIVLAAVSECAALIILRIKNQRIDTKE